MAGNLYPRPSSMEETDGPKLKFGTDGHSGTRIARVDGPQLLDAIRYLMGAVVITASGSEQWYGADQWPGLSYLRCNNIDVEPIGEVASVTTWDIGMIWTRYKLTVSYGTWKNDSDDKDPDDIEFATQSLDYGCDILSIPAKVGPNADPLAIRKDITTNVRLPTITYTVEFPKVRRPKWALYQSMCGKVNSTPVFGGAAETVLFDGPKANRSISLLGDKCWKVSFKFIYQPRNWNKSLNPDTLLWEYAVDKTNGNKKRYELADLRQLFAR